MWIPGHCCKLIPSASRRSATTSWKLGIEVRRRYRPTVSPLASCYPDDLRVAAAWQAGPRGEHRPARSRVPAGDPAGATRCRRIRATHRARSGRARHRAPRRGAAGAAVNSEHLARTCLAVGSPSSSAVELLARICGPMRVCAEDEAARHIVRLCGYLPLGVRIAGARLAVKPHWSLARLANQLSRQQRCLDELRIADLEVRASIARSVNRLGKLARWAFRLLALLRSTPVRCLDCRGAPGRHRGGRPRAC
jgi:hypothetical protein